jgi:phospholipase/carboxylesterase
MNRIKPDCLYQDVESGNSGWYGEGGCLVHESPGSFSILPQFRWVSSMCLPEHYESGYPYPLFLWMNTESSGSESLEQVIPGICERNFIGAAVRDETAFPWSSEWQQTPASIERATRSVQSAIDELSERFNIDRRRVFVAGSGSGGTMAFRVAFRVPHLFAGAASLEGEVPKSNQPLGNLTRSRDVPLFWSQTRGSTRLPEDVICEQLRLLCVAGFDLTFRQYHGDTPMGELVSRDLNRWMMEQIARQPDSAIVF